jgi:serine/threonine protein kinase
MQPQRPSPETLQRYIIGEVSSDEQKRISDFVDENSWVLEEIALLHASIEDSLIDKIRRLQCISVAHEQKESNAVPGQSDAIHLTTELQCGKYSLSKLLYRKSSTAIFEGTDRDSGTSVILKLLLVDPVNDSLLVERFRKEMTLAHKYQHPNLVKIVDAGQWGGRLYVVMERLVGMDLGQWIQRMGYLPVPVACSIVHQVARALQYAYESNFVHRDVKPSNIFVTCDGQVKLLDLGIMRNLDDDVTETESGQLFGTIDYMAPEQAFDTHAVDIRSDIYSLGCSFYKMLTGSVPFSGEKYQHVLRKVLAHASREMPSVKDFRQDIPEGILEILHRMCAKEPENRFSTPKELMHDIKEYCCETDLLQLAKGFPISTDGPVREIQDVFESVFHTPRSVQPPQKGFTQVRVEPLAVSLCLAVCIAAFGWWFVGRSMTKDQAFHLPFKESPKRTSGNTSISADLQDTRFRSEDKSNSVLKVFTEPQAPNAFVQSIVVIGKDERVVCGGSNGSISIVDPASKTITSTWKNSTSGMKVIHSLAYHEPTGRLIGGGSPASVALWDFSQERQVGWFEGHSDRVWSVALSMDGKKAVTGSWDGYVKIWDCDQRMMRRSFFMKSGKVFSVSFLEDESSLAVAGRGFVARIDCDTGNALWTFRQHWHFVQAMAVSPDGKKIAFGGRENTIRMLRSDTGEQMAILQGHSNWINDVAFSPDSQRLLSASADATIRVWDCDSGDEVAVLQGHRGPIHAAKFYQGGASVVSAGSDGTIRFWELKKTGDR